jgi:hypothetical protein
MSEEVADALAAGREYIEKNGWWRGGLVGPNGHQACALGGLLLGNGEEAQEGRFTRNLTLRMAIRTLAGVVDSTWADPHHRHHHHDAVYTNAIAQWNDHKDTCESKQAVLDAFAKAEKIERAGFDPDAP